MIIGGKYRLTWTDGTITECTVESGPEEKIVLRNQAGAVLVTMEPNMLLYLLAQIGIHWEEI